MKVNYMKKWGTDGTVYNQTITIDFDMAFKFNQYVDKIKTQTENNIKKNRIMTDGESKIMTYLEPLNMTTNYTNLTTLQFFMMFYGTYYCKKNVKDKEFDRVLYRNTIFEIK